MMKFRENEEAVSPVIGVILMVAITVILAAVIAAFVFGMGSNVQSTKTVGLNLQKDGTSLHVTIVGGPDLPTLQWLKVSIGETPYYTGETYVNVGLLFPNRVGISFPTPLKVIVNHLLNIWKPRIC